MPDFFSRLEAAALRKKSQLQGLFSGEQAREETILYRLFCEGGHWHPLPRRGETRPAMAVDGGLRTLELSNGGTLIVAQALLLGETIEDTTVDVEILRGTILSKTVDRFADLFRQKLEVSLAAKHLPDLDPSGILYLDGALYGGIPHLYSMSEPGLEDPTVALITDHVKLLGACGPERLLISIAKSSRDSLFVELLQEQAGLPETERVLLPDSEIIYRWTNQQAGYSTPVLLGKRSFLGGSATELLRPGHPVTEMPAILSFFGRLAVDREGP